MSRPLSIGLVTILSVALGSAQSPKAARWEKEIAAIEKRLEKDAPATGGLAFVGSSSVRLWKVSDSFPDRDAVNLGFGGSRIADHTEFAPRLILPLKPKTIVFYAGDNDIAGKRTPEQVREKLRRYEGLADFLQVAVVHGQTPEVIREQTRRLIETFGVTSRMADVRA